MQWNLHVTVTDLRLHSLVTLWNEVGSIILVGGHTLLCGIIRSHSRCTTSCGPCLDKRARLTLGTDGLRTRPCHVLRELFVLLHFLLIFSQLSRGDILNEFLHLGIDVLQVGPTRRNHTRQFQEPDFTMRFAMLAFLTLAGTGVPIGHELHDLIAIWNVVEKDFVIVYGFIGIFAVDVLDDEFSFYLEEDVVGCERTHGFLGDGIQVGNR
mmetsp:Transcript_15301/g.32522  ORF Transcript_15301/g.32522 Transcript_15301/m.32522 type:complete len:210 (+) Transcript_15301:514-1143(+)